MNRRNIVIIVGALAVAALIVVAWLWLFSHGSSVAGGVFGNSGSTSATSTATAVPSTNVQTNVGSQTNTSAGQQTNIPIGGSGTGGGGTVGASGGTGSFIGSSTAVNGNVGVAVVPGVQWLGGTNPGGTSGSGSSNFAPTGLNSLSGTDIGGTPIIQGSGGAAPGGGGSSLAAAAGLLGATAAACFAEYALTNFTGTGSALATDIPKYAGSIPLTGGFVVTYDLAANAKISQNQNVSIQDCLARTIAKAALQQITNSIVNWINNGFNGKPSFVQNFDQYFYNVANVAAGQFIQGTALAFLCSPFQLQIKLAIAQSYANRNAQSCSLSQITNNINGFLAGNFSSGGWPALLQFTTVPTNNPYGAYAYAQIGLATAQQNAVNSANKNVTPGGFISVQKCTPPGSTNCQVTTPGTVIQSTLASTLPAGQNLLTEAGVSGDFDAIINALMTQLTTRALYSGLSSLSNGGGYANNFLTPAEQQAQSSAQTLLTTLQQQSQIAEQYGQIEQGSASDVQNAQQQLSTLDTCWQGAGNNAQASSTEQAITALQPQVDQYNNNVTRANSGLAALQNLESEVLSVTTPADVANAQNDYQNALASGALITQDDVTNAQQDRTTLQSSLAAENQQTAASLAQCQGTSK